MKLKHNSVIVHAYEKGVRFVFNDPQIVTDNGEKPTLTK